jgi:GT2 family glycosyltransferase
MEQIKTNLLRYIDEPNNPMRNFELAYCYELEKQFVAAYSFYLRCAEFTLDNVLACESLIRASFCISEQKERDAKEIHLIKHAICVSPHSPEPYFIASLFFSYRCGDGPDKMHWLDSYMYASLGINALETTTTRKFIYSINYSKTNLYYQKAISATKLGKIREAIETYNKILLISNDSDTIRLVKNHIEQLNTPLNSILNSISYKKYAAFHKKQESEDNQTSKEKQESEDKQTSKENQTSKDNQTSEENQIKIAPIIKKALIIKTQYLHAAINYIEFIDYNYDFFPCHDQIGNDIYRIESTKVNEMLFMLRDVSNVVAINTLGYVKHSVNKLVMLDGWRYDDINKDGIYIKKPDYHLSINVEKKALAVVGVLVCTTTKWVKKQLESIDYPIENYIIINNNTECLAHELDIIVSKKHPFIKNMKVYHMPYNLGCADGWNTIIKSFLFSPYWVIVNDDVSFMPGLLQELHDCYENNKDAGLIHGKPCFLPYLTKFGSYDMFLIRDWVVKEYGLFDVNYYPAYYEDFDHIIRLLHKPIKIINRLDHTYLHGDTTDYNTSGSNTQKASDDMYIRMTNSRYKNFDYFFKKWNINPEYINSTNYSSIYKYPFNNPNNNVSFTEFDFDFRKSKYLDNTLCGLNKN